MMQNTRSNLLHHLPKYYGFARTFAADPPYYMKHAPGNPWFQTTYDGVSTECGAGFTHKKMNWLYRFRWNTQPFGAGPGYLRNPGGKQPHWLEISSWKKFQPHTFNSESFPHAILFFGTVALTLWNLSRYVFFHPDLTIYNVAYFTVRRYVNVLRNQQIPALDVQAFRWVQQPSEFYFLHPHRDMIALGVLANDPYLEYMKAIGKEGLLTKKPGEPGYNTATEYLPKTKWGWSFKEQMPSSLNPVPTKGDAHAAAHH